MPQVIAEITKIQDLVLFVRGQRVLLDKDLAFLYGVKTKVLNQAVLRNLERFPEDFMFQLSAEDLENLRSQFVTSRWGGRRYAPYAFTEQGVAMLSSVLKSPRAIHVNIQIMRVFVKMRQMILASEQINRKLEALERKTEDHDGSIKMIISAIQELMKPPAPKPRRPIGFVQPEDKDEAKPD